MERFLSTAIETTNLDYSTADDRSEKHYFGVSSQNWGRIIVIGVLFAALFWQDLRRLWLKTNPFTGEANWSHSIFVPIIGLYYLFVHREDLIRAGAGEFIWGPIFRRGRAGVAAVMAVMGAALYFLSVNHTGLIFTMIYPVGEALAWLGILVLLLDWSLAIMLFGIAVFVYGIYPGQNDYLKDLGMVITLFGIVLLLNGWNAMRIAWFPIAFLVCAIPWPGLVYSWVAEPLSQMAAHIAVDVLKLTSVDAVCSGTKIIIFTQIGAPPRILNVAEACAGMRSLMTFIAVGGAVAFLPVRPLWQRLIIVCSSVPIAIFCNVMRISGQGLLDHYVSEKWSDSFAHQFVGMIMLLPAFFLILGVGYVLDKLFIEEADDSSYPNGTPSAVTVTPTAAIAPRTAPIPTMVASAANALPPLPKPSLTPPPPPRSVTPAKPATLPPRPLTNGIPAAPPRGVTPPRPLPAGGVRPRPSVIPAANAANGIPQQMRPPAPNQKESK